jgi:hypothetical protein
MLVANVSSLIRYVRLISCANPAVRTTHTTPGTDPRDAPELAWLSGAAPLVGGITWKPVNTSRGANIWSADLSVTNFTDVQALRWNGRRLWRAR